MASAGVAEAVPSGPIPKFTNKTTITADEQEAFCVKYSQDGTMLAVGCGDGAVKIFNPTNARHLYTLNAGGRNMPMTCIKFRPNTATTKTRNVLLAASAEGTVQHFHIQSGKCLHTVVEEGNQIFSIDYKQDASQFVTAGKDHQIRLYDEATKTKIATLSGGTPNVTAGHSNRVFSLKFNPDDENYVVSGGWDNTIQIWDLRVDHSVRSIFGPHVCGDSVDVRAGTVLSGSWRPKDVLQVWDFGSGRLIQTFPWETGLGEQATLLYAACFNSDATLAAAGGSEGNEARVYDVKSGQVLGALHVGKRAVYSVDISPDSKQLAVAAGDGTVTFCDIPAAGAAL